MAKPGKVKSVIRFKRTVTFVGVKVGVLVPNLSDDVLARTPYFVSVGAVRLESWKRHVALFPLHACLFVQ